MIRTSLTFGSSLLLDTCLVSSELDSIDQVKSRDKMVDQFVFGAAKRGRDDLD